MERELLRIANTLVLYSNHLNNNGLLTGKMGVVLFLYRYSQFANCEYYNEFAGKMLDEVLKVLGRTLNDFESGLTGIGWAVNYLLKENILEGNVDSVLKEVDKKVFSQMMCNPEVSIFGHAIYLIERMKSNKGNINFNQQIENILNICHGGFQRYEGKISLYHINSILYFLIELEKMHKCLDQIREIKDLLPLILVKINDQKIFDSSDLLIFDKIFANIKTEERTKWENIKLYKPVDIENTNEDSVEQYIRNAWLQQLYFGQTNSIETPNHDEIKVFIDKKQKSIGIDDFLLAKGLAGLGCALLSQGEQIV